jgi:hypothetical protein
MITPPENQDDELPISQTENEDQMSQQDCINGFDET